MNPLKADSRLSIEHLIQANIKCKLISGDNIYTSIDIAKKW